ncbi:MAG TPA: hypothetical protein VIU64_05555 [Polyangia bacterium]
MKNGHDPTEQIAIPKGSTRVDLRLTKHPVDTPRGRLHRLAAVGVRAADEVRRSAAIDKEDLLRLRGVARRGLAILGRPATRGEHLVAQFCSGLDRTIFALTLLDVDAVAAICEGLILTLIQLEAAENKLREVDLELEKAKKDVKSARGDVTQLRALLARFHAKAAKKEAEEEEFKDEATKRRELTAEQKLLLDPDAEKWVVEPDAP